jgi:hypothetical protein
VIRVALALVVLLALGGCSSPSEPEGPWIAPFGPPRTFTTDDVNAALSAAKETP